MGRQYAVQIDDRCTNRFFSIELQCNKTESPSETCLIIAMTHLIMDAAFDNRVGATIYFFWNLLYSLIHRFYLFCQQYYIALQKRTNNQLLNFGNISINTFNFSIEPVSKCVQIYFSINHSCVVKPCSKIWLHTRTHRNYEWHYVFNVLSP